MTDGTHPCPGNCEAWVSADLFCCWVCWHRLPVELRGADFGQPGPAQHGVWSNALAARNWLRDNQPDLG